MEECKQAAEEVYPPNAELAQHAHIKSMAQYNEMYARSVGPNSDPFWSEVCHSRFLDCSY